MAVNFLRGVQDFVNNGAQQINQVAGRVGNIANTVGGIANTIDAFASNPVGAVGGLLLGGASNFLKNTRLSRAGIPRSANPPVKQWTQGNFNSTGDDWRISLSIPDPFKNSPILKPLMSSGGKFIFPYTPTIVISNSANYNSLDPIHSNYPYFNYQNSRVDSLVITGEFIVETPKEAEHWIASVHYLRSITKMDYGGDGSPPYFARLNGYGDYVFRNVPVIITNFTVEMPQDVDYIRADLSYQKVEGSNGSGINYVPTKSLISVTCQPIYSRRQISQFSLQDFVNGKHISDNSGFI